MNEPVKALIAVQSTERRDALHALLESIGRLDAIYLAQDAPTSAAIMQAHCLALIVTDFSGFDANRTRCGPAILVLVDDRRELEQARARGATQVFVEGTPVGQLVQAIETLLDDYTHDHTHE